MVLLAGDRRRCRARSSSRCKLLWIAGVAISAWLSLGSISAPDLAYCARVYSAWFVPVPHTAGDALWLVRRMVDAFGMPQFAPPRLDGGLRYAVPWLYAIVAVVGFGALWMRQRSVALVLLLPILAAIAASAVRMYPLGGRHTILSVADSDRRGRGRLGVHHGHVTRAHRHSAHSG